MLLPTIHSSSIVTHIARTAPRLAVAITGYPDRVLFADSSDRHVVKAIFPEASRPGGRGRVREEPVLAGS